MPFARTRSDLALTEDVRRTLARVGASRTESLQRVERARMLLAYADGESVSSIARRHTTNRPKVERCIDKALQLGAVAALGDLPGRGRPRVITPEARAWVVALACKKPKDLGYQAELWTTRLLAKHVRATCRAAGHPCLEQLGRGTVSKILTKAAVRPHKIRYYLERRDAQFEEKMAQVLHVYREVELLRQEGEESEPMVATISYDEKPGIQALENMAPDLPPVPGTHPTVGRDHQYVRHGTVSLLAGIDLLKGTIYGIVERRHRSQEFVKFLCILDEAYPKEWKIRLLLDNHSSHISRETRRYLAEVPNRFEFIFTPTHGSWLNLIESFFGKLAKTLLRGIRVASVAELRSRILAHLDELNEEPVVFRWKYGLEDQFVGQKT